MSAWTYCLQDGKAAPKIVPPRSRIPCWKGLGADSEEKHEPASDIDTAVMDSLKALDPRRPIREADIAASPPSMRRLSSHAARTWTRQNRRSRPHRIRRCRLRGRLPTRRNRRRSHRRRDAAQLILEIVGTVSTSKSRKL